MGLGVHVVVHAELTGNGRKIDVSFTEYDRAQVRAIKSVPDAGWRAGDGCWRVNADMVTGRLLRKLFGDQLVLGPRLKEWAFTERDKERNLRSMSKAVDATLKVPQKLHDYMRPYQRAGAAFLGRGNMLNGDDMGLGKTVETIAALIDQGLDIGNNLIVAPKTSVESVWPAEILKWLPYANVISIHGDNRNGRTEINPIAPSTFVCCTPEMLRSLDWLLEVEWNTYIVDEFHLAGLSNANTRHDKGSKFFQRSMSVLCQRKYAISGTPMGGQPLRLWGVLHFLEPKIFSSKWRWADQWLEVKDGHFGKEIGDIKPEIEEEFYKYHAQFILRRKKEEVLPQLPPKQRVEVICSMRPKQRGQYRQFAKEAEIIIDDTHLSATNKLSEMARLKAFASGECTTTTKTNGAIKLHPDFAKGGKADALLERLLEGGVDKGDRQAIVGTQFSEVADSIFGFLAERDFNVAKITGSIGAKERGKVIKSFQAGELQVMVLTLQAGGVSITLDAADHVHIIDEHFNPDVQTQFEDRAHRMSRIHQVTCYYYRTRGTIEEEINELVFNKQMTSEQLLDVVRQQLKGPA
jgi:SNF2 family DNA or RNA helicase